MIKKYLIVSLRKRIDNMVLEFVKNKLTNEEKKKFFQLKFNQNFEELNMNAFNSKNNAIIFIPLFQNQNYHIYLTKYYYALTCIIIIIIIFFFF